MISIQHSYESQNLKQQTERSSDMTTDLTQTLTLQFISEANQPQQVKIEDLQKSLSQEIPSFDIINDYSCLFTIQQQPRYLISYNNLKKQKNCNEEKLGVGGNGQVFLCTDLGTLELNAVKVVTDVNYDNVNPILYECINQYHLMWCSKEMILNIVNLIQIQAENQKVEFLIPLELAEFSLYEYIQTNVINEETYQQLINILIDFLNLLHSNNFAHRDIKPQNILYIKDVGWKLADFGESIKYEISKGMYKIKGTLAFIPEDIRKHSKLNREILQDLFRNDVYATVCTLVMIKNPHFKSSDLQFFMYENQLDEICSKLINITKLEELHQFKQEKLQKFQYQGKFINRKDELVFYDVKLIIRLFSHVNRRLDNRKIQIIDTELGKLRDNNKLVDYNIVVLELIKYFPFQIDKFNNIGEFDYKDILQSPQQYFYNIVEQCQFYFQRGFYQQLINFQVKILQNDSIHAIFIKIYLQIQYGYLDEAKVASLFIGYYNEVYICLYNEYPIMNCLQSNDAQQCWLMKELNNFQKKDLNEQDIQNFLNIKSFKPGGILNFLALLHPLLPQFKRFRNQQIFDHILHHLGCSRLQIQEDKQILSLLIKENLQIIHSYPKELQIIICGCIILYQNYDLLYELIDLLVYFQKILTIQGPGFHNLEQSIEIQRLIIQYNIEYDYKLQNIDKYLAINYSCLSDSMLILIGSNICSLQQKLIKNQFKHRVMKKFKLTLTLELITSLKLVQYQKQKKTRLIQLQNQLASCIQQSKPQFQQRFLQATISIFQQSDCKGKFIQHLYDLRQYQRVRSSFNFNEDFDFSQQTLLLKFAGILLKYHNLSKLLNFYSSLKVQLITECYNTNQQLFQNYNQHLNTIARCPRLQRIRFQRMIPLHNQDLRQMYLSKN